MVTKQSTTAYKSIDQNAPNRGVSGIYQVRNLLNGKRYIGSAQCFRARWLVHFHLLWDGKNHCRHLQSAWTKYGADAFMFEVVELVKGNKEGIVAREQFYLETCRPEYNASPNAKVSGFKWTEEQKAKARKPKSNEHRQRVSEGVKRSYETHPTLRQSRIENFRKHRETHPDYNRGPNNGFYGKAPNRELLMSAEVQARRTAGLQRTYGEGRAKLRFRPVFQLTRGGTLVKRWASIIEAAKALGISQGHIGNVCRGRDKTAGGFRWEYAGERA